MKTLIQKNINEATQGKSPVGETLTEGSNLHFTPSTDQLLNQVDPVLSLPRRLSGRRSQHTARRPSLGNQRSSEPAVSKITPSDLIYERVTSEQIPVAHENTSAGSNDRTRVLADLAAASNSEFGFSGSSDPSPVSGLSPHEVSSPFSEVSPPSSLAPVLQTGEGESVSRVTNPQTNQTSGTSQENVSQGDVKDKGGQGEQGAGETGGRSQGGQGAGETGGRSQGGQGAGETGGRSQGGQGAGETGGRSQGGQKAGETDDTSQSQQGAGQTAGEGEIKPEVEQALAGANQTTSDGGTNPSTAEARPSRTPGDDSDPRSTDNVDNSYNTEGCKISIFGWHVIYRRHRFAFTPYISISPTRNPLIKGGINFGVEAAAHDFSSKVHNSWGIHRYFEFLYKEKFISFEKGNNSDIPFSLIKTGIRSNSLRIDHGKHLESTGSINMFLQNNKFMKDSLFLEGELKYPVKTAKFFVVGLELSASSSIKFAPLSRGNKIEYSVATPYNTLRQLHKKLDTIVHDVDQVKQQQDLMVDVSEQHHLVETSQIEGLYKEKMVYDMKRASILDSSMADLQNSVDKSSTQAEHCCFEIKNGLGELSKDRNSFNPLSPDIEGISPFSFLDFLRKLAVVSFFAKNGVNIIIYFSVGTFGGAMYMIVQTALVHPITRKNIKLAKSLSVVKIFLSGFYWCSFMFTMYIVVTNLFSQKHILTKHRFIERHAENLINLEIWRYLQFDKAYKYVFLFRTFSFYGFIAIKIADSLIIIVGGKLTKSYLVQNIYMVALIAGGITIHKTMNNWYSSTQKEFESKDWVLSQVDPLKKELSQVGLLLTTAFEKFKNNSKS